MDRTAIIRVTYLVEADIVGVLPEALTAQAEAIFTDQTMVVGAGPAGRESEKGQHVDEKENCKYRGKYRICPEFH